jgi:hypothetical protein
MWGQASHESLEGRRVCDFLSVVLLGTFGVFGFVASSYSSPVIYVIINELINIINY